MVILRHPNFEFELGLHKPDKSTALLVSIKLQVNKSILISNRPQTLGGFATIASDFPTASV